MTSAHRPPRADLQHTAPIRRSRSCVHRHATGPFMAFLILSCVLPAAGLSPLKATSNALSGADHGTIPKPAKAAEPSHADTSKSLDMHAAVKSHVVHTKQSAMKRLMDKAGDAQSTAENFQTQASTQLNEGDKEGVSTLPFLLPPIGLLVLTTIGCLVVAIRKWQKIPSMPTQGRMDIEAVKASARAAGGIRTPPGNAKEMKKPQWA